MAGFRFLHAADLHLDSPLVGLGRYEGAPAEEIRLASRRALHNLVDLAIAERVAFVVLAGDVYDGDWRDFNTGVYFNGQLARLDRHGVRVFLVHGNHDAQATMTRSLRSPPNTFVFPHEAPSSVAVPEHDVVLHGQSFGEAKVTRNLALGYPARQREAFNIGVLHTALEGREGHGTYAPCTVRDLEDRGYDYWALGHVHKREDVATRPWIVFPGNLQGRHVREPGSKGCALVTVRDRAVAEVRHVPLDVVRWASVSLDVSGFASPDDVVDALTDAIADCAAAADGRLLAARVRAHGATIATGLSAEPQRWRAELVSRVMTALGDRVWIEKVFFDVARASEPAAESASLAVLDAILGDLATHDTLVPRFVADLARKLGTEAPLGDDSPFLPDAVARARASAIELLRIRLRGARDKS